MSKKPRTGHNPLVENYLPQIRDSREEKPVVDEVVEEQDKPKAKTNKETFTLTDSETFTETSAAGIKGKVAQGTKSRRLEDMRKRQSYYMDPEEIKMIVEISKRANVSKYQVVSAAVRLLYDYVFEGSTKKV